jgi:hypothetical protein
MPPPPTAQTDAAEPRAERARLAAGLRLLDRPEAALAATLVALLGSVGFLLARIVPDVSGKPLFDDEVVAGLTAVHPFGELLDIVIFDRGGAPLHFVLAHVALWFDASPEALRWLSIVFAVATIPVCWNLGRRLGGPVAGAVAAIVAGTSSMLAVYGSVGRMYAIFAFASALAIDLFVRALDLRTPRAAFWAALAALFLPAVHPYGLVVVAVEAGVALAIWRGRPLKPALPILALGVLLTPFVIADVRLSERFGVTASGEGSVAPPDFAARQLGEALQAFAGGAGILALLFFGLALAGLFVVFRSRPAVAVFAALVLAAVPILMVLARAESELVHQLTPRHLMFGLPLWAALVGVGVARLVRGLPPVAVAAAVGAVALAGALAPAGISDPRDDPNAAETRLAAPAAWVRDHAEDDSLLLFYSPVFLEALPAAQDATAVPRSGRPLAMVERADYPVPSLVLALRLDGTTVRSRRLETRIGTGSEVADFPGWVVFTVPGPFADPHEALIAARDGLRSALTESTGRTLPFRRDVRNGLVTTCDALGELGDPCSTYVLPRSTPP